MLEKRYTNHWNWLLRFLKRSNQIPKGLLELRAAKRLGTGPGSKQGHNRGRSRARTKLLENYWHATIEECYQTLNWLWINFVLSAAALVFKGALTLILSLCCKFWSLMWFLGSRWYQKKAHMGFLGASASLFLRFCFTSFSLTTLVADFDSANEVSDENNWLIL